MTTYVSGSDLASVLEVTETPAIDKIAELTNNLIDGEWVNPTNPVPPWVTNIAWAVAVRAGTNPKGVTSSTRSWDDITVTDRWEAGASAFGVELTDDEKKRLNTASTDTTTQRQSIPVTIPRWNRAPGGRYGGPDYGGIDASGGGFFP